MLLEQSPHSLGGGGGVLHYPYSVSVAEKGMVFRVLSQTMYTCPVLLFSVLNRVPFWTESLPKSVKVGNEQLCKFVASIIVFKEIYFHDVSFKDYLYKLIILTVCGMK